MYDIKHLFKNLPIQSLEQDFADILATNCPYLVPAAPVEEKNAFFGLCSVGQSFLEAGTGHFNPLYKTEQKDGIITILYSFLAKYEFCFNLPSEIAPKMNAIARDVFNAKHPGTVVTQSPVANGKVRIMPF